MPNRKIKIFRSGNKLKPLKSKLIKLLPEPLKPTKYVPIPKPRTQKSRSKKPKPIAEKVQKTIDEITPYYKPEAIRAFQKNLRDKKSLRVKVMEKGKALKTVSNHLM